MVSTGITRPIRIGDVYMIFFDGIRNEQRGYRPGLVVQNNVGNMYSKNIIILPLTSVIKKVSQPTHVVVRSIDSGLEKDSVVLCENPACVSKDRLTKYITTLPNDYMTKVAEAYILATSIISFLSIDTMHIVWEKASSMNSVRG